MGRERPFRRGGVAARLSLVLALAAGPAAGSPGPSYRTVAQAWNGVAPCLARPPESEPARREHLCRS